MLSVVEPASPGVFVEVLDAGACESCEVNLRTAGHCCSWQLVATASEGRNGSVQLKDVPGKNRRWK